MALARRSGGEAPRAAPASTRKAAPTPLTNGADARERTKIFSLQRQLAGRQRLLRLFNVMTARSECKASASLICH
jgi:hypothetical protein